MVRFLAHERQSTVKGSSKKDEMNIRNVKRPARIAALKKKHGTKTFRKTQRVLKSLRR